MIGGGGGLKCRQVWTTALEQRLHTARTRKMIFIFVLKASIRVHAGDAVTVPPGKRQRDDRHRDDDSLHHQEMPYAAAIRRAFCSWVARRVVRER